MRFRIKLKYAVIAAVNAAAVAAALVMTAAGSSMAKAQRYNYAADSWSGHRGGYEQVSCFLAENSGFVKDSVLSVRMQLTQQLSTASVKAEPGKMLFPDAYSAPAGKVFVTGDLTGSSQAQVTAAGGDFFMFRSFQLLSGSYFSDSDLMHDGAVIDRTLAFRLYGSDNVAGMNLFINGQRLLIAGVIDEPATKYERECKGELPDIYVPYEAAASLFSGADGRPFSAVTCYECVLPDPVEDFAYKAMNGIFSSQYEGNAVVVDNSKRFSSSIRTKTLKKLSRSGVRDDPVKLPYWENASRIVEYKLTVLYSLRRAVLIVPAATALWLLILAARTWKRNRNRLLRSAADRLYRLRVKIHSRFRRRKTENGQT